MVDNVGLPKTDSLIVL